MAGQVSLAKSVPAYNYAFRVDLPYYRLTPTVVEKFLFTAIWKLVLVLEAYTETELQI